jgi:hypothetical protein
LNGTISAPVYAWWHLNENTGTFINDSSGNNRNGTTLGSPSWVAGKLNNALSISGATQYADFGNSTGNFERTQAFSVELWFKTVNTGQQIILSKMQSTGNYAGWEIYYDGTSTNNIVFDLSSVATTNHIRVYCTPSAVADNNWHHIVVTYDGSSNASGVKFYFDGSLKTTGITYNNLIGSILNSVVFQLSGRGGGTGGIVGSLDEVVIYNGTLTSDKVTARYNSGAGTENAIGTYQTGYYTIQPVNNFSFSSKLWRFNETAIITGSEIRYSVISNGGWKYWNGSSWATSNGNWTQSNSASDINMNIGILASSGNLSFRAILHSNDGSYTPYLDNIFTVYDSDAPIASNVNASLVADTTAIITWATNENANSTINYGIDLSLSSSNSNSTFSITHSTLLTSLSAGTLYFYNVTSCDTYGNCGTSGTYNFTTTAPTPPTISSVNAVPNAINSTVTWNTNLASNSTACYWITGFGIFCNSDNSPVFSHSIFINGLTENTWYNYYVISCTSLCTQSANYTFKTTFTYSNGSLISSIYVKDNQVFKKDGIKNIVALCYDTSSNFCNGLTNCNISIRNPDGDTIINNVAMDWFSTYYDYNATAITTIGDYSGTVYCIGGNTKYIDFNFKITPSGMISTSGESLIYSILIIIIVFFFALCLFGSFKIKSNNEYDMGGKLMKITYGKYLKMFLFWLSIVFLWILFFLGWQISDKVLMFDFVGMVFHTSFTVLTYLIAPFFFAFVVLAIFQWTADLELWKLAERGLRPRNR